MVTLCNKMCLTQGESFLYFPQSMSKNSEEEMALMVSFLAYTQGMLMNSVDFKELVPR